MEDVYARRDDYLSGTVSHGALILFAGVDVQKDRLEVSVWGFGRKSRTQTAETRLDVMMQAIGTAVAADRTLGGLCDYLLITAAQTAGLTSEGAQASRYGLITIVAVYGTTDPLN